jgi:general secretion pathway protein K
MRKISRQPAVGSEALVRENPAVNSPALPNANASLPTARCPLPASDGVILVALLWILTALSVIALSFAKESFVEVAAAKNAQAMERAYYAARAGMATTIYQLIQKRLNTSQSGSAQTGTTQTGTTQTGTSATVDTLDLGVSTGDFGEASYQVDIQDEGGKININTVPEQQLHNLIEATGIGTNEANIICDSILDWRDSDTEAKTNGAEDDYYLSLDPSYKAKNANFDTIEELLLVRGVTTDYFYGHSERADDGTIVFKYGLSRFLSANSASTQQTNVNFAEPPSLMSIPGITGEIAVQIYERRKNTPFKSLTEVTSEIPGVGTATSSMRTATSGTYTLTAIGQANNSKARRIIRAVVNINASQGKQYQTLYWNENVTNYESTTP